MGFESWWGRQEGLDELRSAVGSAVPEDHDRPSTDVAEQVAEERNHLWTADRAQVHPELQATSRGDSTDRRELRPSAVVNQYRGLADRRLGLRDVREEREAAFVDEHYDGSSPSGSLL